MFYINSLYLSGTWRHIQVACTAMYVVLLYNKLILLEKMNSDWLSEPSELCNTGSYNGPLMNEIRLMLFQNVVKKKTESERER